MSDTYPPDILRLLEEAERHARRLNCNYVQPEHVILALGPILDVLLGSRGLTEKLHARLVPLRDLPPPAGALPLSDRCRLVLDSAEDFARWLEEEPVQPIHLILSLLNDQDGLLSRTLRDNGNDPDRLYDRLTVSAALELKPYRGSEAEDLSPLVRLLDLILATAIKSGATDVHFEPFENECRIRYRVDGLLYLMESPPVHFYEPMVARLKALAALDPETRQPQDGRFAYSTREVAATLVVSTLPTIFGESVVAHVFPAA